MPVTMRDAEGSVPQGRAGSASVSGRCTTRSAATCRRRRRSRVFGDPVRLAPSGAEQRWGRGLGQGVLMTPDPPDPFPILFFRFLLPTAEKALEQALRFWRCGAISAERRGDNDSAPGWPRPARRLVITAAPASAVRRTASAGAARSDQKINPLLGRCLPLPHRILAQCRMRPACRAAVTVDHD